MTPMYNVYDVRDEEVEELILFHLHNEGLYRWGSGKHILAHTPSKSDPNFRGFPYQLHVMWFIMQWGYE